MLPMFPPGHDPGPDFHRVLRELGLLPLSSPFSGPSPAARLSGVGGGTAGGALGETLALAHGTTICAVRYRHGLWIAAVHRATAEYAIAHRTMEKVHPADAHSEVAIAGVPGPAL